MKSTTRRAAIAASLAVGLLAGACGDDDDAATTTTTVEDAAETTAVEVTLTSDGIEGMPAEVPAGLLEITLTNETGDDISFDLSRVADGTTEEEFTEGLAPVFEGGAFPGFLESNVGVQAEDGETTTSLVVLQEGDHIAWFEVPQGQDPDVEGSEAETETATETETETETETATETEAGTGTEAETGTETTTTTSTTVAGEEEGAAGTGEATGTLTAVAAEDDAEGDVDEPAEEEPLAEEPGDDDAEGEGGPPAPALITMAVTVTSGDAAAELPEADGEIVATDYEFDATLDGPGTISFRNDGPQQFHHAVLMDFGTNDPAAVEEAFPAILESEGDPSALPEGVDVDLEQVEFDFGGSGVFGPDAAGTFEADIVEGNTYVLVCFIQDRTGGPPHAIAYDMWDVVQAGDDGEATTTTGG